MRRTAPPGCREASTAVVALARRCARELGAGVLALLLAGTWSVAALEPTKALSQFPHRAWQTADGLPQNSILSLVQRADGYLWGGTWEGLVRFDGVRFTTYNRANTPALPDRTIRCLALAQDGTLWIGTDNGLTGMREGSFFPVALPAGTTLRNLNRLSVARDGSLWIATEGHGLLRMAEGRFQAWGKSQGLASDRVLALAEEASGAMWVGTQGGLQRWQGGVLMQALPFEGRASVGVSALTFDPEGTLWAGTEEGEVYRWHAGVMRQEPAASLPGAPISALLVDGQGSLWVGSTGLGLLRLVRGQRSMLGATHALAGSVVTALLEDAEGNLWVGTEAHGLHRLKDAPFTPYGPPEGLAHDMVAAVYEARDGSVWFATVGGGVSRWREGQMRSWTTREGLVNDRVIAIAEQADGSLWFGTARGVSRWREGQLSSFSAAEVLPALRLNALAVDAQDTLWVGTTTGLARWNGARFEPFTPRGGLPGPDIILLQPSAAGGLWVGTSSGGLAHLLEGETTLLTSDGGALESDVMALHEEADVLWVGTAEGLYRWKQGRFRRLSVADGLFDDRIFQILADEGGHLWMSSNRGVFRVSRAELEAVAEGRLARVTSRAYGREDGMRSEECNAVGGPAGWRGRDGRLWFPTIQGAIVLAPEHEERQTPLPPTLLEEVRVDGRSVARADWGRIPPGDGQVELHYTVAGLHAPHRLRFRYRLEGVDADWVEAGTRRVAYYTQLPPGDYTFHVEAREEGEHSVAPGARVALRLLPRFHQTLAFRVACALAAMLALAGALWLRMHRSRARERELQERVDQRSAELAAVNADLQARLQELQAARERLVHAEKMAAVGTLAAGVGHEINNPLAFIIANLNYAADEVRDAAARQEEGQRWREVGQALGEALEGAERVRRIVQDLKTFSRAQPQRSQRVELHAVLDRALGMAGVGLRRRARVVKDYGTPPAVLGDELRLSQVFLNLLINAAQALPEGEPDRHEIRVTTRRDERGHAVVTVSDTGAGIPPEVLPRIFEPFFTTKPVGVGTGLGLSICHTYVQAMGGEIRVHSEPGRSTTFELLLPALPAPQA